MSAKDDVINTIDSMLKELKKVHEPNFWQNGPDYLFTGKNWNLTKIKEDKNGNNREIKKSNSF